MHNLVISNVPGPPVPLYFMGAEIKALYPLGPIMHGAGLNVTVMSNNGEMHVGVIACRESMPDVDALVRHFPTELARLKEAVAAREQATPIAKGRAKRSGSPEATDPWVARACADPRSGTQRLVSYLVRSTPSGNVRVSTRFRFTRSSRGRRRARQCSRPGSGSCQRSDSAWVSLP